MAKFSTTKVKSSARSADKITYGKLRKYNFIAAAFLGVQGILVLILSDPKKGLEPVTSSFLTLDKLASSAAGHPVLSAASHHLFDINLAYLVAIFFFISALAHLLVATAKRKTYESDLKKGINRIRWIDYAFSASIMMVAIALLSGVFDFASLLMIFVLMAIMSLLGLYMELRNQGLKKVDWASYYLGVIAGITPWLVIVTYVWNAHINGNGVPGFVYISN